LTVGPSPVTHTSDVTTSELPPATQRKPVPSIIALDVHDIRFPTSRLLDGSDAMNLDPDYSVAYVVLRTDHPAGHPGHGFTFTIGRAPRCVSPRSRRCARWCWASTWTRCSATSARSPADERGQPAALARAGEGRDPPGGRRGDQRRVGPVLPPPGQAAVAGALRDEPGAAGRPRRLPLHQRRADAGAGPRAAAQAGARPGGADRGDAGLRAALVHHLGGLAGLRRREAGPAVPRGGRRRLEPRQAEGRPGHRAGRPPGRHRQEDPRPGPVP